MNKYARPIILVLALAALGASIAALYVHYRIIKDPTYSSFCDISETVSCEAVLESPYATVRGVPVAAGGVAWSTLVLLLAALGMRRENGDGYAASAGYIFVLATVALSAVLYLGYASFFVIGKVCPLCMTMYVAVIGIFLVSGGISMALSALPSRLPRDLRTIAKRPTPAVLALLFIVALLLQTSAALVWAGSARERMARINGDVLRVQELAERSARLEEQVSAMRATLERIETKLDRLGPRDGR